MENLKEKICNFDSLYAAMLKCSRGVKWKDSVAGFLKNGIPNCMKLESDLSTGKYKISKYSKFVVYEPKKRDIVSTRYVDRVFQRSMCDEYLIHELTKRFIYDNGACLKHKGPDFARGRVQCFMERYYRRYGAEGYFLKCDVKDFFGSLSHEVAKREMRKYVSNDFVYGEVCRIIDSFDGEQGIGLGSEVSQLIMTTMLNRLDHVVKEKLRCQYYERYMDDMVFISGSKRYLQRCREVVEEELSRLGLRLNRRKTQIVTLAQGIDFLGFKWRLSPTGKILKSLLRTKATHEKRKLKRQARVVSAEKLKECFRSWREHARKATYRKYIIRKLENLFRRLLKYGNNQIPKGAAARGCA